MKLDYGGERQVLPLTIKPKELAVKHNALFSFVSGVALSALSLTSIGCGTGTDTTGLVDEASVSESRVHIMPLKKAGEREAQVHPSGAHLNNYGGPVIRNVNVIPIYWNSSVAYQSNLNGFYQGVPNSAWQRSMTQYGCNAGTRGTPYVDNQTSTSLTDASVRSRLNTLFNAGVIPAPNSNNYYPIHFPAGVSITASDGSRSCVQFCAYHGTYVRNGVNVYYGIIPDQGGGCAGGCGSNSLRVNNLTSVSSHELGEAMTDPAVGLATVYGPPLAWYDPNYGENGDICNAQQGTTLGSNGVTYVVQQLFSNSQNDCVVQ